MARVTVICSSVICDAVAVKVIVSLEFSAFEVAEVARVTVGADSFSVIVTVTLCVPDSVAPAPETPEIAIIALSLPS